mmetsp:Transcript_56952/g.123289  ORF Transcript_56952/g.123289 Transcript_56952/m.123289 type:complete len:242 (+) Transcript_56952:594-1319(+)
MSRSMIELLSLAVHCVLERVAPPLTAVAPVDPSPPSPEPGKPLEVTLALGPPPPRWDVCGSAAAACAAVSCGLALYAAAERFRRRRKATSWRVSSPTLEPLSWQSMTVVLCFSPSSSARPPSTPRSFQDRSRCVIVVFAASICPMNLAPTLLIRLLRRSTWPTVRFDLRASQSELTPVGSLPIAFHFKLRLRKDLFSRTPLAKATAPFAWMLFPRRSKYLMKGLSRMNLATSGTPSSEIEA